MIVNQFHAWTGNRVNRNRRKKISNENGIKLFHAKSLEKLIGSNDKKYKENCRGFFSHYIPEIIAIFHLLHSQKKSKPLIFTVTTSTQCGLKSETSGI